MYHYVYRITHVVLGKHYYGKRSCKNKPQQDLGIKYFSSSRDKAFIKDQKQNPDAYKYKIIRVFNNNEEALAFEVKLHNKFNVGKHPKFFNNANQTSTKFDTTGKIVVKDKKGDTFIIDSTDSRFTTQEVVGVTKGFTHSEETCKIISNTHKGRSFTQAHKDKLSKARRSNPIKPTAKMLKAFAKNRLTCNSQEARKKRSEKLKGRKFTEEHKRKIGDANKGVSKPCKLTPEQKIARAYKVGKLATIFNASDDSIIADNVIISLWCKENGFCPSTLSRTTRRDLTQPKSKENVYHHKGVYAVYKETS